jgi:DDE superfamily endonuclease
MPEVSAEVVAQLEDVLDLYADPSDPQRPKVNVEETRKQLSAATRTPVPAKPGEVERYDSDYQRTGTRTLCLFWEPQAGWRQMEVTEQRPRRDFAHQRQWLVDERYPPATTVRVVRDHLNTHKPASLYETVEPAEARRILKRLEFHHTSKHGRWLNMAESEFSGLSRQCLDRRILDEATLIRELRA